MKTGRAHLIIFIKNWGGTNIGVASLGPGGPGPPPDFLKITITQTSRSAVYNTGKSEIVEKFCP